MQANIYRNDELTATQPLTLDQDTAISADFAVSLQLGDTVSAEVTELSDGFDDTTGLRLVVLRRE